MLVTVYLEKTIELSEERLLVLLSTIQNLINIVSIT